MVFQKFQIKCNSLLKNVEWLRNYWKIFSSTFKLSWTIEVGVASSTDAISLGMLTTGLGSSHLLFIISPELF